MHDFEDDRTRQLIEEREAYEKRYYEYIISNMVENDNLDRLIAERFKYIDSNFDFEATEEYKHLEELYLDNNDDMTDEPFSDALKEMDDDRLNIYKDFVEYALVEYEKDQMHLEKLIKEHLEEEKSFMDDLLIRVIDEDYLFEKAIDELIFKEIGIDYDPDDFNYTENNYWFDDDFNRPDESVVDPFDNFEEIDYPQEPEPFETRFMKEEIRRINEEHMIQEDLEKDFAKYQRQKKRKESKQIERFFRDYFTKDDTLDRIIKQKLKEKKFDN